jgi:hypothetical protein
MADLELYKVDLNTPQPNGRLGETPRAAFTKYNDLIDELEVTFSIATGWGDITGTLADQTDLQAALDLNTSAITAIPRKNFLINGNFDVWQRATSHTTSGYGSVDRWQVANVGTTKATSRQAFTNGQTAVPNNPKYFCRTVVSSVSSTNNYCLLSQKIEGVQNLSGGTTTISFWAKADATKDIAVEFSQDFGSEGSPSTAVNGISPTKITLTTAWQKFELQVVLPSIAGKTIGTSGNDCLVVNFWFDAGSSFNTRTASLGQQSGTFDIAQVQLETGNTATAFDNRSIGQELALCQRYFQTLGNLGLSGAARSTTQIYASGSLVQTMRSTPTVTQSGLFSFSSNGNYTQSSTGITISGLIDNGIRVVLENFIGLTAGFGVSGNGGGSLFLDSEL